VRSRERRRERKRKRRRKKKMTGYQLNNAKKKIEPHKNRWTQNR
jgi:hypothetical protein